MIRIHVRSVVFAAAFTLVACSKSENNAAPTPSASAPAPSASAPAPSASAPAPSAKTATSAATPATGTAAAYAGTYSLTSAKYYIADTKDFASVKQVKDDPSKFVGDGAVTLAVSPDGKVTGTIDSGPASPALIDGSVIGTEIRGKVRRKDVNDDGLTGVFSATIAGDTATGTLSLAESNASLVRDGKLTMKRK
jgi:hypothetical protein